MNGILQASFDAAKNAGATKITDIRITIGELSEVQEVSLEFAFEALTPDTMAEGATLSITKLPARSRCLKCGAEYEHDRFQMACPECGDYHTELLQGRELRIDSIETEDDDPTEE